MERPFGITVIASWFGAAALYLWAVAVVLLIAPGSLPLGSAHAFMRGAELAGPYMMLLVGCGWAVVGWGLFRLHNWARWVAMLAIVLDVAALVPAISMAALGGPMFWYGMQIAFCVAAGWYLAQAPAVLDAFTRKS